MLLQPNSVRTARASRLSFQRIFDIALDMAIDLETARRRALNVVAENYRGAVELTPIESLHTPAYLFDPTGWFLLMVHRAYDLKCDVEEYVAVHSETGEVRRP